MRKNNKVEELAKNVAYWVKDAKTGEFVTIGAKLTESGGGNLDMFWMNSQGERIPDGTVAVVDDVPQRTVIPMLTYGLARFLGRESVTDDLRAMVLELQYLPAQEDFEQLKGRKVVLLVETDPDTLLEDVAFKIEDENEKVSHSSEPPADYGYGDIPMPPPDEEYSAVAEESDATVNEEPIQDENISVESVVSDEPVEDNKEAPTLPLPEPEKEASPTMTLGLEAFKAMTLNNMVSYMVPQIREYFSHVTLEWAKVPESEITETLLRRLKKEELIEIYAIVYDIEHGDGVVSELSQALVQKLTDRRNRIQMNRAKKKDPQNSSTAPSTAPSTDPSTAPSSEEEVKVREVTEPLVEADLNPQPCNADDEEFLESVVAPLSPIKEEAKPQKSNISKLLPAWFSRWQWAYSEETFRTLIDPSEKDSGLLLGDSSGYVFNQDELRFIELIYGVGSEKELREKLSSEGWSNDDINTVIEGVSLEGEEGEIQSIPGIEELLRKVGLIS